MLLIYAFFVDALFIERAWAQQAPLERQVKAVFLYNFAKFVEWPAHNFPALRQSFLLCVLGDDPFGGALERAVSGKSVQDRSFTIRHVADLEEVASCHMLFVSTSETGRLRRLVTVLQGAPILIVGDEEDAAYAGGMIAFHMEGNRVRFLVNQDAVERSGLQVSSQLLKVADRVITTGAVP